MHSLHAIWPEFAGWSHDRGIAAPPSPPQPNPAGLIPLTPPLGTQEGMEDDKDGDEAVPSEEDDPDPDPDPPSTPPPGTQEDMGVAEYAADNEPQEWGDEDDDPLAHASQSSQEVAAQASAAAAGSPSTGTATTSSPMCVGGRATRRSSC